MNMINRLILGIILACMVGCTTVPPGYVGIRVNMYGNQRGVEDFPIETGRVWYNPITEDIYPFPTFMQNYVWTNSKEHSEIDESITFNSNEGAVINADVALSYQIEGDRVAHIFVELRKDAEYITQTYMRSKVRDALSRHASKMKVVDIFGTKKEQLLGEVKQDLIKELHNKGIMIDMVSFVGGLRVDKRVENSINATIEATQRAIEASNKVKQSEAEAQQKVAEAKGRAEAIMLEAEAKSEANRKLTESLSPALLQYEALQKWDGVMPKVTGGALPFINLETEIKK